MRFVYHEDSHAELAVPCAMQKYLETQEGGGAEWRPGGMPSVERVRDLVDEVQARVHDAEQSSTQVAGAESPSSSAAVLQAEGDRPRRLPHRAYLSFEVL